MEYRYGTAVSPGIAVGPALVLDTEGVRIPHKSVPTEQVGGEVARLREALSDAAAEAKEKRQRYTARFEPAIGNIFAAQQSAFEDTSFRDRLEHLIRSQNFSAEYAVSRGIREQVKKLEEAGRRVGDLNAAEVLRRRAGDLIDLEKQILTTLLGQQDTPVGPLGGERVVILANDLIVGITRHCAACGQALLLGEQPIRSADADGSSAPHGGSSF